MVETKPARKEEEIVVLGVTPSAQIGSKAKERAMARRQASERSLRSGTAPTSARSSAVSSRRTSIGSNGAGVPRPSPRATADADLTTVDIDEVPLDEALEPGLDLDLVNSFVPYEALRYLVGECNYGGRVTDDKDRRLLQTLLRRCYTPAIMSDQHNFSPSGTYFAPPEGGLKDFQAHVDALPLNDEPSAFGLHENADITSSAVEARRLLRVAVAVHHHPPVQPHTVLAEPNTPVGAGTPSLHSSLHGLTSPLPPASTRTNVSSTSPRSSRKKRPSVPFFASPIAEATPQPSEAPELTEAAAQEIAEISAEIQELMDAPGSVAGGASSTGGMSPADVKQLQQLLWDIQSTLPEPLDLARARSQHPPEYLESRNVVLAQEIQRYNSLLSLVNQGVRTLQDAILGLVVMTQSLEATASQLLRGEVPAVWRQASFASTLPVGGWLQDLQTRVQFFRSWVQNGRPNVYWLPGFFFPQGFLTALLQNYARKTQQPIDTVHFDFHLLGGHRSVGLTAKTVGEAPADGAVVHGLWLEGAAWDWKGDVTQARRPIQAVAREWGSTGEAATTPAPAVPGWVREGGLLIDAKPRQPFVKAPMVWLRPTTVQSGDQQPHQRMYACPLYATPVRQGSLTTTGRSSNFIVDVMFPMPKDSHEDHWIARGAALLCQPP